MKPKKICLICFKPLDEISEGAITKICNNCWDKKDIREAEEDNA